MSDEVEFLVNWPPLVEAEINEWHETITSHDECVGFEYGENRNLCKEAFVDEILELWVLLKDGCDLL